MKQAAPKKIWICSSCDEEWNDEEQATLCCAPEALEAWACEVCDTAHDDVEDAIGCCANEACLTRCPSCCRDYNERQLNHFAIAVAGHCNTCNPLFTPDQQFAINDMIDKSAPWITQPLR